MTRQTRLYSLFRRDGTRWVRVGSGAYPKPQAVRIFQSQLINSAFSGSLLTLRPVPHAAPSPIPAAHVLCASCEQGHHHCAGGTCACACALFRGR